MAVRRVPKRIPSGRPPSQVAPKRQKCKPRAAEKGQSDELTTAPCTLEQREAALKQRAQGVAAALQLLVHEHSTGITEVRKNETRFTSLFPRGVLRGVKKRDQITSPVSELVHARGVNKPT